MGEARVQRFKIVDKPGEKPVLCIQINREDIDQFEGVDESYIVTIKKARKKSMNMNSYMWVLCDRIAKKIHSTKEEVYRQAIAQTGKWIDVSSPQESADAVLDSWSNNGIGWWGEKLYDGPITQLRLYIGSSDYNGEELQRVTDSIVEDAKELGIETMTPNELEHLRSMWDGVH